ncbi:MAG: DUF1963 domain-containing protein [Clostridiaceae bacterium]|nr:DUF1963 domain-containing protein [Clostridiaceae bacterium]
MSERIPCITEGCRAEILQITAERTGGYCMPCHQKIKRKEQEDFIKKNRKDINLYEGISDLVEILKIMHTPLKRNPLKNYAKYEKGIEEIYLLLSEEDIERIKAHAINLINNDSIEVAKEILLAIVCYINSNVEECLRALIKRKEYYPGIIFKDASVDIRDYLIGQLNEDLQSLDLNHIISALAWIGDQNVVDLFNGWKDKPPKWKDKLFVPPEEYSLEAGWALTENGKKQSLFYEDCYVIEKESLSKDETVLFLENNTGMCKWCRGNLINLFEFDLTNLLLEFIGFNGKRLSIATCPVCNCYGPIYTEVDTDGGTRWSDFNSYPDYFDNTANEEFITHKKTLRISRAKKNCYHAASEFLKTSFSQIGGYPTWIQHAEYPKCPKCSKHMKFIGQIDWADIEEHGEGIYYAFACAECNIAATDYQQS